MAEMKVVNGAPARSGFSVADISNAREDRLSSQLEGLRERLRKKEDEVSNAAAKQIQAERLLSLTNDATGFS